jgi:GNAT superfamily N-acetyltransferase
VRHQWSPIRLLNLTRPLAREVPTRTRQTTRSPHRTQPKTPNIQYHHRASSTKRTDARRCACPSSDGRRQERLVPVLVEPATSDRWCEIGVVFGPQGKRPDTCWCQRFRRHTHADNRAALHDEITNADIPVGLIARDGDQPAGWTRVVPRATLPGVTENRALARILDNDPRAWWVTCVVVRRENRGQGVGVKLLTAAVDWATQHGATVLDGHPVDLAQLRGKPSPSALFTGTLSMFHGAGFSEVGRTYRSRPVMRWRILDDIRRPAG